MAAKSKIQRLQDALQSGDLDTAKRLADEVAAATAKRAAKRPSTKKATRVPPKPVGSADGLPGASRSKLILLPEDVEHEAPQPRHIGQDGGSGQDTNWMAPTRRLSDKVKARNQSMQGIVHPNGFDDWMKSQGDVDGLTGRVKQIDKKILAKAPLTPRPGSAGAKRPVAVKMRVHCDGCNRPYEVYPTELRAVDNESVYKCDRCIRRGK
jgi:hypothetical protein